MRSFFSFALFFFLSIQFRNATASGRSNSFQDLNGFVWFYTTAQNIRFTDITRQLDSLKKKGFRVIGVYSPYHGRPEKWLGCAPIDFYNVSPQSGTVEDWKTLVRSAHERGMKVVAYFANIYLDKESDFFLRAALQYRGGDRSSSEVSSFRWSSDADAPLPVADALVPQPSDEGGAAWKSQWRYSAEAGAYYWSIWGEAGFDFRHPGAQTEVERIMKFWLDTGLDGFMFDAGLPSAYLRRAMVDLPVGYTANDKWLTFESTSSEEAHTLHAFGLTGWFNFEDNDMENDYSRMVRGEINADGLEESLKNADFARALGKTTHAWSLWREKGSENEFPPYKNEAAMRVQEAALLAGSGILYGSPDFAQYRSMPNQTRVRWEKVLTVVNAHPALHPSASRIRLPTGRDKRVFAMLRVSRDRSQKILLVFNFHGRSAEVTIDLKESGLKLRQHPKNVYDDAIQPDIAGPRYRLSIPAYGFRMLQVD